MRSFCVHVTGPEATGWPVAVCRGSCQGEAAEPAGEIPLELPLLLGSGSARAVRDAVLGTGDQDLTVDQVGR